MEVCIITKRSLLYCSTTQRQNHGAFNFTSLNNAILQLPRLSAYALYYICQYYSTDYRCCCQSPCFVFATFGCLNCNAFGKLWCSKAALSHNELHCRTSFSHPFYLELLFVTPIIFMRWISHLLIFSSIGEFILCASILTQPENNAADVQISMVIVITDNKGFSQSFLLNPA